MLVIKLAAVGTAALWEAKLPRGPPLIPLARRRGPPRRPPSQAHQAALPQLPSRVVACVPRDQLESAPWYRQQDPRRTAPFMAYALCAAAEARRRRRLRPSCCLRC